MVQPRKVIYVDFTEKKRSRPFSVGGGPKVTVLAFFASLCALVVAVAVFLPAQLLSGFFAPTVILVSLLVAIAVKKILIRLHVGMLHRTMTETKRDQPNRTLH